MKLQLVALLVAAVGLCAGTGCESVGRSGASVKDTVTTRSIERERLHGAADIKTAYDASSGDADEVVLLFLNACLLVEENKEAGGQAIAYLSRKNDQSSDSGSPTGVKLSQMASGAASHLGKAIIRSYCGGDGSDFRMGNAELVDLSIKDTQKVNDTTRKYFLWSKGKDNASPVTLRSEGGRWYVDEWSSLQTGVTAR